DRTGVIYQGRRDINQWQSAHAVATDRRFLAEALDGADVFMGLSAARALPAEFLKKRAKNPIVFAMANPDPEITPPEAKRARP
ncbi:NAD-dependent malic enzyme, partial [Acinetobacter baumannii]